MTKCWRIILGPIVQAPHGVPRITYRENQAGLLAVVRGSSQVQRFWIYTKTPAATAERLKREVV